MLARWWQLVASVVTLNRLYWAMRAVSNRCIPTAIKTASKVGVLIDCYFVDCRPGAHWGDTEQVVARCRYPVASGVALVMPHWAMPSVLLGRTTKAIKTAGGRGAFVIWFDPG